ncbi:hypothetical protein K1719_038756 [Acacia pycnantha]|nr:hypothetical protein K1719_038756 [Acacia pycnantha]
MGSISWPSAAPNLHFPSPKFSSSFPLRSLSSLPFSLHSHHSLSADATAPCRCVNPASGSPPPSDDSVNRGWDSMLQDIVRNSIKRFDSYVNGLRDEALGAWNTATVAEKDGSEKENREPEDEEWDWDRWRKHFQDIDEQERLASILKSQISCAVCMEDFEDAARLKFAIAAAATHDSVGRVITHLNKAIEEQRYTDATFLRDKAGAGLVGWWSGISKDANDPHGPIICITPDHGRYVARSYSPRQLATSAAGVPLFEIFLTEYESTGVVGVRIKAVYLKRGGGAHTSPIASFKKSNPAERFSSVESPEGRSELLVVKVLNVTPSEKVDKDLISKLIEQIIEEDEDEEEEEEDEEEKESETENKSTKIQGQHPVDHVIFDLAKFIGGGKVLSKVLKDVGELITSSDLLNGLYIDAHGLYSSEIIQLRHKFGQWQEESGAREPSDLVFYEYVEAFKLTGDPYVPAGQEARGSKRRGQVAHYKAWTLGGRRLLDVVA